MTGVTTEQIPALDIRDLRVSTAQAPQAELLHGVSLRIARGERVGLVGESGSGKSVLSLTAMGLLPHSLTVSTGSVRVRGCELVGAAEPAVTALRGDAMAMIYQDPMSSLNPVQTVGHQIVEAIRVHHPLSAKAAWRQAVELLDDVDVREPHLNAKRYPHEFSGGMRQRVMIAMALSGEPDLLLADEPTTALDVTTQATILRLLQRLAQERGMGVLFVTHDLAVAASFCERIDVMSAGNIVESNVSSRILTHPQHDYTKLLLGSMCSFDSDPDVPLGSPQLPRPPASGSSTIGVSA